jgi:hypothetical protein
MQETYIVPGGEYADVGSRLSKSFSLYRGYFVPFFLMALITFPLTALAAVWEFGFVFTIPNALIGLVASAAIILGVEQALPGKAPEPGASLSAAMDRFGRLIEYALRTLGAVLGLAITIIGIPWAIRVGIRWFFGSQAIMLHGHDAKGAISESCRLVEKNWWRTFGNLILIGLIVGLPNGVFTLAFPGWLGGLIGAALSTLTMPFGVIAITLYYLRLRQEKGQPVQEGGAQ